MHSDLHDRAVAVVRRYEDEQTPFILSLRTYRVATVVIQCAYADTPFELRDFIARKVEHGIGVICIKGDDSVLDGLKEEATSCPALSLPDEKWKEITIWLIAHAAFIVCEFNLDSNGVCWEIEQCRALKRQHETILVISTPSEGKRVQRLDHVRGFNRFVLQDELPYVPIFKHPSAVDLFESTYIAALGTAAECHYSQDYLELLRIRPGYAGFISDLCLLADRYARGGQDRIAVMYYQCVVNVSALFAERNAPMFPSEVTSTIKAAVGCATGLVQIGDVTTAYERLDLAETLCRIDGQEGELAAVAALRQRIAAGGTL